MTDKLERRFFLLEIAHMHHASSDVIGSQGVELVFWFDDTPQTTSRRENFLLGFTAGRCQN